MWGSLIADHGGWGCRFSVGSGLGTASVVWRAPSEPPRGRCHTRASLDSRRATFAALATLLPREGKRGEVLGGIERSLSAVYLQDRENELLKLIISKLDELGWWTMSSSL